MTFSNAITRLIKDSLFLSFDYRLSGRTGHQALVQYYVGGGERRYVVEGFRDAQPIGQRVDIHGQWAVFIDTSSDQALAASLQAAMQTLEHPPVMADGLGV